MNLNLKLKKKSHIESETDSLDKEIYTAVFESTDEDQTVKLIINSTEDISKDFQINDIIDISIKNQQKKLK